MLNDKLISLFLSSALLILSTCVKVEKVMMVSTGDVTSILANSATIPGEVIDGGESVITARGTCWATAINPTTNNSKTTDGTGTGSFNSNLTGLIPGTTYHVRAYATNNSGTVYGKDKTFSTKTIPAVISTDPTNGAINVALNRVINTTFSEPMDPSTITTTTFTLNDGLAQVSGSVTCTGSTASFTPVSNLLPVKTYTCTITQGARNQSSIALVNDYIWSFTTSPILVPALTTNTATSIGQTTTVSGGNITSDGGGTITSKGVCWSTTINPTITDSKTSDGIGTANYTSNLTGLLPGTTYHIRAYATNSTGTGYGNDVSFTTLPTGVPTLSTTPASSVGQTTAVSGGNITSDGGGTITTKGVCWSTNLNPTISDPKTIDGVGTTGFTSNLSGLLPGTTYHIRAYASNSSGTGYGNDVSFTTVLIGVPSLTTNAASSIGQTSAVSGGNITSDGGGSITSKGVCWSTNLNPTISDFKTIDGTGTTGFTSNLTGLVPGTTYHIRSYAINSAGSGYGNDISFTTSPVVLATLSTSTITSITTTTSVTGGNITADGGGTITARGVCWAITTSPTIANSKTTDGTGTGIFISNLSGLQQGTSYYIRAYATNSAGTSYGNQVSFNTKIADVEGNAYNTVTIGTQVWMAENLKTVMLNDNTPIPNITNNTTWTNLSTPAYSCYNNDETTYKPLYGILYNWFTVNTGKLCPSGWHVPTTSEWTVLTDYLTNNGYGYMGSGNDIAKSMAAKSGWTSYSTAGAVGNDQASNNSSGFSALAGGDRNWDGVFDQLIGNYVGWWTATEFGAASSWTYSLFWWDIVVHSTDDQKRDGMYVRCLKN